MGQGDAFTGYTEGPLLFRPTYKYDLGFDRYDSSEKYRIPAWTGQHPIRHSVSRFSLDLPPDRILFRGPSLDLAVYSRAELKSSDHRPGMKYHPDVYLTYSQLCQLQCLRSLEQLFELLITHWDLHCLVCYSIMLLALLQEKNWTKSLRHWLSLASL